MSETYVNDTAEWCDRHAVPRPMCGCPFGVAPDAGDDERPLVAGQSLVAQRLVELHPGRFMFVPGIGWHVWDGVRWDTGNGAARIAVEQAVVATARRIIREAADVSAHDVREAMLKLGHAVLANHAQVNGVVEFVRAHPDVAVRVDRLNADPLLLNVLNGTLDLRGGDLLPHRPADRITRVAGCDYDHDARGERWNRFLAEALGDPGLVAAVARCFGGCGLPGIVREHVLPIVQGPGGSGKGTFIEAVSAALGDYAIAAEPELLMASKSGGHPTGTMDLLGVRLAFVSESDDGRRLAAATMKRLTGGDTVRARRMRQDFVEFSPSHLLALVTNHLPVMPSGDDPAVWRRVRVIPFTHQPDKPDKQLPDRLREELPAILAWLVDGYRDYCEAGDEIGWPGSVTDATSAYRDRSDVLGQFLDETTTVVPAQAGAIPTGRLYAAWRTWLESSAPDVRPGRTGDFVVKLRERGERVEPVADKGARSVVRGRLLIANKEP